MASDYGFCFGFRRSSDAVREGRFKTPTSTVLSGVPMLQGTAVEIDSASAGYLKQSAANAAPLSGFHGLLVQEEIFIRTIYESPLVDSFDLPYTRFDALSVITSGQGQVKVWLKNLAAATRADGRAVAAITMLDVTSVSVGDGLGWDGSKWVKVDGSTITHSWMTVTSVSGTAATASAYAEAVLTF
jgi:hypothetical protein